MKRCILITGGARSGKSRFALALAKKLAQPVLFVATAVAGDEEMKRRIENHRRERPAEWRTLEATTGIGTHIRKELGEARVVIIDCIALLVNNVLSQHGYSVSSETETLSEQQVIDEISQLVACIKATDATFIIVTNEVGLGIVPADKATRLYRDLLGRANQMLASCADEVHFMVAGLPVKVKPSEKD